MLNPAVQHTSHGRTTRITLTLKIPIAYDFKPSHWIFSPERWTPKPVGKNMEYSTVIEGVGSGKPYPVNYQFEFDRPSDDIYQRYRQMLWMNGRSLVA